MIHHLIMSTIIACTGKTPEHTKNPTPPTPPEIGSKEIPKPDSSNNDGEEITPSTKPELIGPIIDTTPIESSHEHKGSILVQHIVNIQQSNQEISCLLLCQQSVKETSFDQGSFIIRDCSEQRVENWFDLVQRGDTTTSVGEVTCELVAKPIPRVIKGRAPLANATSLQPATSLSSYFSRQAQEEAISVFSFAELYQILYLYGAPASLIERCVQAIKEEQAHTRMAVALCEQYGGSAPDIQVPRPKKVSLFHAALHNSLVGCIQETWAAVLEEYQAQHTQVHHHIQRRIAKDEISHAQLSWDIHDFFMSQLSEIDRSNIIKQMCSFVSSNSIGAVKSFPRSKELGIPSTKMHDQLYNEFSQLVQQRIRQAA